MKKTLFILFAVAALFLLAAPLQAQSFGKTNKVSSTSIFSDLKTVVAFVDQMCPISAGSAGNMTALKLTETALVIEVEVNEEYIDLDALRSNPSVMRNNFEAMVQNASGYMDTLYTLLAASDKGFVLKYTGASTGKKYSCSLTNKELKSLVEGRGAKRDPMELLNGQIAVTNLQMPMKVGEGLTIDKVYVDGNYVVYNCITDESLYPIDALNDAKAEMKKAIAQDVFNLSDPTMVNFMKICVEAGKGIAYQYVGNTTGKKCFIGYSVFELRSVLYGD